MITALNRSGLLYAAINVTRLPRECPAPITGEPASFSRNAISSSARLVQLLLTGNS